MSEIENLKNLSKWANKRRIVYAAVSGLLGTVAIRTAIRAGQCDTIKTLSDDLVEREKAKLNK